MKKGECLRQKTDTAPICHDIQSEYGSIWNDWRRIHDKNVIDVKRRLACRQGSVEWPVGLVFLLFLLIILCASVQLSKYRAVSLYLEDTLAASNLASAVADIEEYGISHQVKIKDYGEAYARYKKAVKENLNLDENWMCANRDLISGQVCIEDYIVYNVKADEVFVYRISEEDGVHTWAGKVGTVKTPNGITVEQTGVYSELSFPVEGFWGIQTQAHKSKFVDVVAEREDKDASPVLSGK